MEKALRLFGAYLRLLIKSWAFWVFLSIDLLGLIVDLIFPQFQVPSVTYWLITLVGLIGASFQIYQETLPIESKEPEIPRIGLDLIEGNEYSFGLATENKEDEENELPEANVTFHLRIQNQSSIPIRILRISASATRDFFENTISNRQISELNKIVIVASSEVIGWHKTFYPVDLESHAIMACELRNNFRFAPHFNAAQFAAYLAQISDKTANPKFEFEVEAQNTVDGSIIKSNMKREMSWRPLRDLYITYWQERNRDELLEIVHAA